METPIQLTGALSGLSGLAVILKANWPQIQSVLSGLLASVGGSKLGESTISDVGRVVAYRTLQPALDDSTRKEVWRQIQPDKTEEAKPAAKPKGGKR